MSDDNIAARYDKKMAEAKVVDIDRDMENGVVLKTKNDRPTVVITGFGPFSIHEKNPSWEAVSHLRKIGLGDDIHLEIALFPVEYEYVKNEVKNLWNTHKPKLVVHCGVSGVAKELTLEQQAHNSGYQSKDIRGLLPLNNCCNKGAPDTIKSGIEMKKVCERINSSCCPVNAVVSDDPGRYLCDYVYYNSLSIDNRRTAFIHVPPLNKPYSVEQLAEAIRIAVLAMLDQLSHECICLNGSNLS